MRLSKNERAVLRFVVDGAWHYGADIRTGIKLSWWRAIYVMLQGMVDRGLLTARNEDAARTAPLLPRRMFRITPLGTTALANAEFRELGD